MEKTVHRPKQTDVNPVETSPRISAFLLERFHIGEVTPEEKKSVEQALAENPVLAASLAKLEQDDLYFRDKFPRKSFFSLRHKSARQLSGAADNPPPDISGARRFVPRNVRASRAIGWTACAAALALIAFLPLVILRNNSEPEYGDRIKGAAGDGYSAELSVYLKDERGTAAGSKLTDWAPVRAGNTVQLAYRLTETTSGDKYGVIFSIDGRSSVTMHYPYSRSQSTRLFAGNAVPLAEAYTLDDAPGYEMFFFVVGSEPLNVPDVLSAAERIAPLIAKKPQGALRQGADVFKNCELQIVTLRKE